MTRATSRTQIAAIAVVLLASGCSHSDEGTAAVSTPSVPATAATVAATLLPASPTAAATKSAASVDDKHESYSKNGVTASMGVGTEADFSAVGLPVYPTMRVQDTFVVKHIDKHSSAFTVQGSVKDDTATVGAFYARKLGPSFKGSSMAVLGGIRTFSRKTAHSTESVLIQAQKDANLGIPLTTITLTVTKRY